MTRFKFMVRLVAMILLIAAFQIGSMEILIFHIMDPDWNEVWVMMNAPGYVVAILLGTFTLITYFYVKPLPDFLARTGRGEGVSESDVRRVQNRGLNFPYFMAVFGFPFYMAGGYWGVRVVGARLGWPESVAWYGLLSGTISAFLASPLCVYAYGWVAEPVIRMAGGHAPGLAPSRVEGMRLSVRTKLVATIFVLAVGIASYPMVVGYSQSRVMYDFAQDREGARAPGSLVRPEAEHQPLLEFFRDRMAVQARIYLTLFALTCLASLALAYLTAREITTPILLVRDEAARISQGGYDRPVALVRNDEFAELGVAINRMTDTIIGQVREMEAVVEALRGGVRSIDQTARTVLDISSEQAAGATEQASAVQESSTIAQQIVASAGQIEERAAVMGKVAASTADACREGDQKLAEARKGFGEITEQVDRVWSAMENLQDRFQETYKIVELMDDVAEQIELLSLNAALEAAGAGEAGKRFSVVAQSTRRLAQRSADSAREIRGLLEVIQNATLEVSGFAAVSRERVGKGGTDIDQVGAALANISLLAGSTAGATREITLSTRQQTTASDQLARSIFEVQEVAQKVEQGARQIQEAIAGLESLSRSLHQKSG
ncbi:MAG TPA: methyl-accepting chemotaxis protein [bacterium]|nr:methyl-accepting chemotaxis protein [bacterium]